MGVGVTIRPPACKLEQGSGRTKGVLSPAYFFSPGKNGNEEKYGTQAYEATALTNGKCNELYKI